jgi:hypothetical protein
MPITTLRRLIAPMLIALATACAGAARPQKSVSSNRSVVTDVEIPTSGTESAYDLIQRIRPEYLRAKPTQSYSGATSAVAPPPSVFLDGQRMGELADLRQISAPTLSMIRYYGIEEGKQKFGMQYGGGVIEIRFRGP